MHPTAARELPADQRGWAFEPKWDGYRALGHVVAGELALRSRNGVDMAGWFPELAGLAGALGGHDGVLDGEVVAADADGRPNFGALQQRMAARGGRRRGTAVTYLVFDVLWLDGRLLTGLPYTERRRLLEDLAVAGPAWQTVASFPGAGTALLEATREQGLEGVVAKKLQSTYVPGRRTRNWLKTKQSPFAEPTPVLLGGRWTRPGPDDPAPVFVRPDLAVEVSFLGWESGRLRHPAYSGLTRIL